MCLPLDSNPSSEPSNAHCWEFATNESVPYPIVSMVIINPVTSVTHHIEAKVDTGFNGVIGLTPDQIQNLNLESEGMTTVQTASGTTSLSYFKAIFSIQDTSLMNLQGIILQTSRTLIGRTVLNLGSWYYHGVKQKWCFVPV